MKYYKKLYTAGIFIMFIPTSLAQEKSGIGKNLMGHNHNNHNSHYISEINNEIKALTDEEVNQLLIGEGMGLAKAAELNNYPGPKHVLDLANELNLTKEQYEKTQALFNTMKAEAKHLGNSIIEKEKELDLMFQSNSVDEKSIRDKILEISQLNGLLRFVHLDAHLKQKEILTSEQVNSYNKFRGYN